MRNLLLGITWFVIIGFAGMIVISVVAYQFGVTDTQAERLGASLCGPLLILSSGLATFGTIKGWLPGTKCRGAKSRA